VFEVLEHLTQQDYKMALSEIQRVSKKYIGVSVPNQEPLEYYLVVCPACRCHFNLSRHVRSFDYDTLKDIFDQYTPLKFKEVGGWYLTLHTIKYYLEPCGHGSSLLHQKPQYAHSAATVQKRKKG